MLNFTFHNPVNIIFGKDTIHKLATLIPQNTKIMLTYGGGSIKQNGVYDQVIKALSGHEYVEFGGIEPNPKYETIMKAYDIAKKEEIGFLLAVGGGSVIDATKLLAAGLCIQQDPRTIMTGETTVEKAIPLGVVLTLPATGTEMNGTSVVSRESTNEKLAFKSPHVMPVFSILDPQVCFSLPKRQIANGIVDAFVHVMEQYLTYPVNTPLQDRFAESILTTLIEEGPKVYQNPHNYDAMANLMWSATMALNGMISRGCVEDRSTHIIGHELTALYEIDHARTLALVLPGNMRVRKVIKGEKILQYGERVWGISQGSLDEKIEKIIAATEHFFHALDVPTSFSDYPEIPSNVADIVAQRLEYRGLIAFGEKGDITPEIVRQILNQNT